MKKYSLVLVGVLLALAGNIYAQAPKIYTIPAAFDKNEDVTLYLDVTGTALDGETGTLYLWSWSDAGDNQNNGGWGTFANPLNKVEGKDNLYSATINVGKDYPEGSTEIQGLVATQDGSTQTDNSDLLYPFDFNKVVGGDATIYPAAFGTTTPVSIIANISGSGIDINTLAVHLHSGLNGWATSVDYDSDLKKTALSKVEGYEGVWRINLIPSEYYGVPENEKIDNIMAVFNNGSWGQEMKNASGDDFAFVPKVGEDGPQAAKLFLKNFTPDDVLPIIVNTKGFEAEDPLYEYNGSNMVFSITLSNEGEGYTTTQKLAAQKTGDYTYMVIILPARQFEGAEGAEVIEVSFSAGGLESAATLKGDFIK